MIVDASVVLRWFLNEPGADDVASLFKQTTLNAPTLILIEVANGLWGAERGKRLTANEARRYLALLPALFGKLQPSNELFLPAFEIARELAHPVYDCVYLAMAEAAATPFLTADSKLQARVTGTRWRNLVSVLTPP